MGRPRKIRKQSVSLFPFLDILACVIGNLILIIASVVLEKVDTQPVAEAARIEGLAEEAARVEGKAAALEKQRDELRKQLGVSSEKLNEINGRLTKAKAALRNAEARVRDASKPVEPSRDMTADIKKLDEARAKLEAEVKHLQQQIANRSRPPEQMIAILPAGDGGGPRKGVFVEAAKDGLVIHDGKSSWKVPTGKIPSDPKFADLLKKVAADSDAIVTFLVRPDGIAALTAGQKAATTASAKSGRVPLPGDGALDFSGTK
jgi:cell division protein FtsB